MLRIFIGLMFVCCWNGGFSQVEAQPITDSLYLNSGGTITGKILRYNRRGNVLMELYNGSTQEIQAKCIQRVVIHASFLEKETKLSTHVRTNDLPPQVYAFRERGIYNATYASGNTSTGFNNQTQWGFGLQHTLGYQWNRWIGTGIGVGLENFSADRANASLVFPVYAEARGYLLQKSRTPYYSVSAGYGFATKKENIGILTAKGGLYLHPAFGIRLGARDDVNFLFDLGYLFQQVELTRSFNAWTREVQIQDIWYKRLRVRIGMVF